MIQLIDFYSETNRDNARALASTSSEGCGQAFNNPVKIELDSCKFFLKIQGNNPNSNAFAKVYAVTGTLGTDAKPTGAALATSDAFSTTAVSLTTYNLHTFNFTGANRITLQANTNYCIVVEFTGGTPGSQELAVGQDTSTPTHAGNETHFDFGVGWLVQADTDTIFYVYGFLADTGGLLMGVII